MRGQSQPTPPPPRQPALIVPPPPQPNPFAAAQLDHVANSRARDGPRYTTVGSLVNPNSTPQFARPVRRSAAVTIRNSQGEAVDVNNAWRDRPLQYSPLQQNTDRAVSPPTVNLPSATAGLASIYSRRGPSRLTLGPVPTEEDARLYSRYVAAIAASRPYEDGPEQNDTDMLDPPFEESSSGAAAFRIDGAGPSVTSDNEDDANEDESLRQMSVKTLTNLASYENPQQRTAQRILSRAREITTTQQIAGPSVDHSAGPSAGPSTNPSANPSGLNRNSILEWDARVEAETRASPVPYNSILSNGPGAPRPLTAGPPGLRQYRPIANPATARQSVPLRDHSTAAPSPSFFPSIVSELGRTTSQGVSLQRSTTFTPINLGPPETQMPASATVYDTLSAEDARRWYRNGVLPSNFNDTVRPSIVFGYGSSLENNLFDVDNEDGSVPLRDRDIHTLWTECSELYSSSMDTFLTTLNNRRLQLGMDFQREGETEEARAFLAMLRNDRPQLGTGLQNRGQSRVNMEPSLRMLLDELDEMSAQDSEIPSVSD